MNYGTAKSILSLMSGFGWILMLGGGYLIFESSKSANMQAVGQVAFGVLTLASGAITVAIAQMGMAQIATAENTSAILRAIQGNGSEIVSEKKIGADRIEPVVRAKETALDRLQEAPVAKVYKGRTIYKARLGVNVDGNSFNSVVAAEKWIDSQPEVQR